MAAPKTIVFIHGGAIGDLVQTLPAMAAVRAAWPGAAVTLIGRPERAALAVLAGAADKVVDIETCGLWRVMGKAEAPALPVLDGADLVIDLFTKGKLAAGLEKSTAGQDRPPATARAAAVPGWHTRLRIVPVDPLPPEEWNRSAAAWILDQVREALGLAASSETPVIQLSLVPFPERSYDFSDAGATGGLSASVSAALADKPPVAPPRIHRTFLETALAAADAARTLPASRGVGERFVAIHPGSGSTAKNWPADRFAAVARRIRGEIGRDVVWLAGPAERERGTLPPEATRDTVLADLSLEQVAGVLTLADGYLGNDSGITQMAAAVRRPDGRATPTVALFGPTDPRVWAPRGEYVRVIAAADGRMESIAVEEVGEAVTALLTR